jgi:hypothetical protein
MKRSAIIVATAAIAVVAGGPLAAVTLTGKAHTTAAVTASVATDPTAGLKEYTDTYKVQKPYNLPVSARFSVTNGEYNAWILKGDKPFSKGSTTGARTEMRWATNWSTGEHLWEADVLVDSGTSGTAIMQVHAVTPGEAIYIQVKNGGNIYNSENTLLVKNMWGQWFHMDCAYNPSNHVVMIWINGKLVLSTHYSRPNGTKFYFKNGVYNLSGARSETHFKNIEFWES